MLLEYFASVEAQEIVGPAVSLAANTKVSLDVYDEVAKEIATYASGANDVVMEVGLMTTNNDVGTNFRLRLQEIITTPANYASVAAEIDDLSWSTP
jgi:hypothetical protein